VRELVEAVADRGSPIAANRLLAFLKKFFSFCISQDLIESSPAQFVTRPGKEIKRDRVLSAAEIKALWRACDDFGVASGGRPSFCSLRANVAAR
jgi:site-specific recombinase XerD